MLKEQLKFLHDCKRHRILPMSARIKAPIQGRRMKEETNRFGWRIVSCMIGDAHNRKTYFSNKVIMHEGFCRNHLD